MKPPCDHVQKKLAELGLAGFRQDADSLSHLAECEECYDFLLALQEVTAHLANLSPIEPPPELIEKALVRVSSVDFASDRSVVQPTGLEVETSQKQALVEPAEQFPPPDAVIQRSILHGVPAVVGRVIWSSLRGTFKTARSHPALAAASFALALTIGLGAMLFEVMTRNGADTEAYSLSQEIDGAGPESTLEKPTALAEPPRSQPAPSSSGRPGPSASPISGIVSPAGSTSTTQSHQPTPEPTSQPAHGWDFGAEDQYGSFLAFGGRGVSGGGDSIPVTASTLEPSGEYPSGASGDAVRGGVRFTHTSMLNASEAMPTDEIRVRSERRRTGELREGEPELRPNGSLNGRLVERTPATQSSESGRLERLRNEAVHAARQGDGETARTLVLQYRDASGQEEPEVASLDDGLLGPVPSAQPRLVEIGEDHDDGSLRISPEIRGGLGLSEVALGAMQEPEELQPLEELAMVVHQADGNIEFLSGDGLDDIPWTLDHRMWGDASIEPDVTVARRFLSERTRTSDLGFREPRGYWANTYVPGDPLLRTLQRRLTATDETSISSAGASGIQLASHSRTYSQPFDSPDHAALTVFMAADRRGVQQASRVLVQVGIQGTMRQIGRRPAMNIGIVLDLREPLDPSDNAGMRALLEELSEANDIGDRFSLIVAGRPGGVVIPPSSFRYGPVTVAIQELLSQEGSPADRDEEISLSLLEAFEVAIETVAAGDDPHSVLGSSMVMLVTPNSLAGIDTQLERLAHLAAVEGIPTSMVGVGRDIDLSQLDRIALAGQGNRRLLSSRADAQPLVADELAAASRVIARAVRLRIRLASGVQLVDVLGSYRLDEVRAEQVRQAEQSIDLRLARNLGIQADRGPDEDGIQIVIPTFYAEDSHVILLDVVVPGAGPVADVTVRFKDLVHLNNGVARDNLTLLRGEFSTGPIERNVFKNLLAYELSESLKRAGSLVAQGRTGEALNLLYDYLRLLRGLHQEIPELTTDPEIETDIQMLARYVSVLGSATDQYVAPPNDLADSLLYAGYLKLLPPPRIDSQ